MEVGGGDQMNSRRGLRSSFGCGDDSLDSRTKNTGSMADGSSMIKVGNRLSFGEELQWHREGSVAPSPTTINAIVKSRSSS